MSVPGGRGTPRPHPSPLHLLVGAVVVAGASAAALAIRFSGDGPIVGSAHPHWQVAVGLVALACLAEVAYVRLRHGETTEDLTFFEAVVVIAALMLPVTEALGVALGGLLLASLLLRRRPVKVLFNLGSYAAGASVLVLLAHLGSGSEGVLGARTVLGLVAGTIAFAAVNLLALSAVLSVVEGGRMGQILASEWQLSAVMALGNAGAGMMAVEIGRAAPALLPFVVLPILTLAHSYRSAVRHAEEKERSRWLASLGAVLAGQPDGGLLLPAAETTRGLFAANRVHILLAPGAAVVADEEGARLHEPDPTLLRLLAALGDGEGVRPLPRDLLPTDCLRGIGTALDLGPSTRGALVVGWGDQGARSWSHLWRRGGPAEAQLSTLVAVATAVSNAIRAAEHLQALIEETSKLQAVVSYGTDGVAVLTPRGDVLVWSPAMTQLTGIDVLTTDGSADAWRPDPALGDPVVALLSRLGGAETKPADVSRALASGGPVGKVVITVRLNQDERRNLEVSVTRITQEASLGDLTVMTARDVTEAARLERLKADFIAGVSHELRTPITPIKGYAQLLATRGHLMEPARRLHALQLIEDRADHLSRLVDDLLLASRVGGSENPEITIEPTDVDLRTIVEKSMSGSEVLVDRSSATLPDHPVMVRCDTVRAVQCLSNLLSNAVKYSPPESPIHVEVTDGAQLASVSVTDVGRGIPTAELERVFERFHRVDDAFTMQTSGSGLGLYIARELARAMGGDLTLVSRFGVGSTLTLSLPRAGAVDLAAHSTQGTQNTPGSLRLPEEARR